ncbi:MAG: hypothetical protein P0Y60_16595 [Candidatus Microbacterium colombiense]|nr:MAG: hypothetical protein P0Y60_16595 [Microbacterium sp.]
MQDSRTATQVYGPPRAITLAFDEPEPAIAYAVPVAAMTVVAAAAVFTALAGDLVIANGEATALAVDSGMLLGIMILAVAASLAQGFGLTAATLAIIARVDGGRLTARGAWSGALRRPGSVLLAAGCTLALAVVVVALAAWVLPAMPVVALASLVALFALGIVAAPLLLAWPLVVARRQRVGAALAWAWRSPKAFLGQSIEPLGSPRFAVVVTVILTGILSFGISWLGGLLPSGWWTPVVGVALGLVPAALTQLLLVGVAVRGVAARLAGPIHTDPIHADAIHADAAARPAAARRGGALAGIGVLLVPAIAAGALIAVNPWQVPAFAAADVKRVWKSSQIVAWDGGTVVLSRLAGQDAQARICTGETCGPEHEMRSVLPTAIAPAGGGVLSASWFPLEGADPQTGSYELRVTHSTPDALARWSDPLDDDASDAEKWEAWHGLPGEARVLGSVDATFESGQSVFARDNESRMVVAVDTSAERPVIASAVRPEGRDATLAVDFCADAECTQSTRTSLPLQWGSWNTNQTTLDVAASADGRSAVVTLVDAAGEDGAIPLRVLTATTDGDWTTEALDADVPGDALTDLDTTYGAQVTRGADGLPIILFRAAERAGLRLFSCTDAACSTAEFTDIVPGSALLHTPALALDATGRPLIGVIDEDAAVALLSCTDVACVTRTTTPLTGTVPTELGFTDSFSLALDESDHPLIAVGARRTGAASPSTSSGTILTCATVRCGAP